MRGAGTVVCVWGGGGGGGTYIKNRLTHQLLDRVSTECEDLYNMFFAAFAMMAPCDVSMKNYDLFMDAARQDLPRDKVLVGIVSRSRSVSNVNVEVNAGCKCCSSSPSTGTLLIFNLPHTQTSN